MPLLNIAKQQGESCRGEGLYRGFVHFWRGHYDTTHDTFHWAPPGPEALSFTSLDFESPVERQGWFFYETPAGKTLFEAINRAFATSQLLVFDNPYSPATMPGIQRGVVYVFCESYLAE